MKKLKKTAMISIMVFFVIATGFLFQKSFFNKDSSLPEKKKTQETEEKMNSKTKVQKVQNTLEDEVDQPLRLYVDGEEKALEEDVLFCQTGKRFMCVLMK